MYNSMTLGEFLENCILEPEYCNFVIYDTDICEFIRNEDGEPFYGKSECPDKYLDNYLFATVDGINTETHFLTINVYKNEA